MTGGGVTGTRGEMTDRGVIEGVGGGLESDIDKEKSLIKLKNDSESQQWGVGFSLLAVALLEVGKALWDRPCPLEDRAKLWEKVRLWVLTKMLGREHPSECNRTWLLEELDPWELDPEAQEHLRAEIGSLCEDLGRLLTSTTNMAPAPEFTGPRMLPLVRRGVHWASYSSFTAQERGDLRRLHQRLGDLSRRVSEELSSGAPGDLSSLEKELEQLKSQSGQQTLEVVARIEYTLDRKIPEPRAHIPPGGNQPLGRRTSKSGGDQSGDVEVGSSSRPGSLQQKQTVLNSGLLDPVTPSEQFDGSLTVLLSGCTQSGDAEERSRSRSGSLQQKQTDLKSSCPRFRDVEKGRTRSRNLRQEQMVCKSGLRNKACFWKWTAVVAFVLLYIITLAVVIFKSTFGPSAVLLRNDNGCYRTDWMPSMNKYFWNKEETDWDTSSRLCQEKNGTLAVLHDELQVSELLKEYGRRYPWVGLHKLEEEFQWLDGTSWNSTVFPLNGYGDCVYLRKDVFSVNECTMRRSSLCRRKPCD